MRDTDPISRDRQPVEGMDIDDSRPIPDAITNRAYELAAKQGRVGHPLRVDFEKAQEELRLSNG